MSAAVSILMVAEYAGECWSCGVPIWIPKNRLRALRENPEQGFYCCNGHSAHFKKSAAEKLREELEREKTARAQAESDAWNARQAASTARKAEAIVRGKLKAAKERVGNGVCPCCTRSFTNLRRHMATKHPEYKTEQP